MKEVIKGIARKFGYKISKINDKEADFTKFGYDKLFAYFPSWVSKFKLESKEFGGYADYDNVRVSMLNMPEVSEEINFKDKSVLELGPLEAGNSIILERMNPSKIISIEGRTESYIKCCMIKNIYDLNRTKFYLDDARNISSEKYGNFDVAVVLGLLYHLDDPHVLLDKIGKMADKLVLSTHYADEGSPYKNAENKTVEYNGKKYSGRIYQEDPDLDPNAGLQNISFWPFEEDLVNMVKDSGYNKVKIIQKNPIPYKDSEYKLIYLIASK